MRRAAFGLVGALAVSACATVSDEATTVTLTVVGPPIAASETIRPHFYAMPELPEGMTSGGGILEQHWSMWGREDRSAAFESADEYRATQCAPTSPPVAGREQVLDAIVERARDTRVVIVNESHYVTLHRDFTRRLIERLRPLGYTVFAAETFSNLDGEPDPAVVHADLPYPHITTGYYSAEPTFGRLVRRAQELGYRLGVYEQVHDPEDARDDDINARIVKRETAQAAHLAEILETMGPEERLVVHVGYAHARESISIDSKGIEHAWMAARLKRATGIDPLTVSQFECRGGGAETQITQSRDYYGDWFDISVDHPLTTFRHGRAAWRFDDGYRAVAIPREYAATGDPLVIEAFAEGEPFDAVPIDRVYVEPGEDVRLALPPGRYTVRAVRLSE